MEKQNIVQTLFLPDMHREIEIRLTMSVNFVTSEDHSLEINLLPQLIPLEYYGQLWADGICVGVREAVRDVSPILTISGIEVKISDLKFSVPLESLKDDDLGLLRNELKNMSREVLRPIFSKRIHNNSTRM